MTAPAFEMVDSTQIRRKAVKKPAIPKPVTPELSSPKYVARKSMQIGGRKIRIGDVVPEAVSWPRIESWIRAGYLDVVE